MSKIKISDFITRFLVLNGIKDLFLISGGGIMHLLDSAAKQPELQLIFNLNEQASGICAESYAQFNGHLGACMVTTGPGATNAVTGCAGAFVDSTPVLFLSGQCRIPQMGQLRGLRIYGPQEIAIVPMVTPITKYAVTILKAEETAYHLEKAVYLATHGRRGPVWIDVPLDIQGSVVEETDLLHFDPEKKGYLPAIPVEIGEIKKLYGLLNSARRPALFIGHGVVAAGVQKEIRKISEQFNIPILASWRAKGVFGDDEPLFMGSPGIPATRYSNYVLQNCDLLLIIGSRLNPAITAFDEPHFALHAKKIMVDIERCEIEKLDILFEQTFIADAGNFIQQMLRQKDEYIHSDRTKWLSYCIDIKARYPLCNERQPIDNEGKTDGYLFAQKLSQHSTAEDIFVGSSSGRSCGISHMAYSLKKGQRFITSMGLGSMGWCVPSAIACSVADGKKRAVVIEGDGSLQHNLQELALINTYTLPLKLFIISNGGYASIYTMQKINFEKRFAGCDISSGLCLPPLEDIAKTYNLTYYKIKNNSDIEPVLQKAMADDSPCLCEVICSINFDEIPKSMTIANVSGGFSSSKLENLYPFLDTQEQKRNMPNWNE